MPGDVRCRRAWRAGVWGDPRRLQETNSL